MTSCNPPKLDSDAATLATPIAENGSSSRNMQAAKVLVLGSDTRMVLPVLRSLGRRGVTVHLGWCIEREPALWSRYAKVIHRLPQLSGTGDAWRQSLTGLLERESYQLVIPTTEDVVLALDQARGDFSDHPIVLLEKHAYEVVTDKAKTQELAHSLSIPIPDSLVAPPDQIGREILDDWPLPLVIKPLCSVRSNSDYTKRCVRIVESPEELCDHLQSLARDVPEVVLQRYFEGVGVGVELLADKGDILFAFQHQRLHETRGYGSSYRKSVPLSQHLLDASAKLMRSLDYTGVAMVEFRVDPKSGNWVLLEVNGRFWGSLPLATASGADFPWYLYQLIVEGRRSFSPKYRVGVHCRNLSYDFAWLRRRLFPRKRKNPSRDKGEQGWEINKVSTKTLLWEFGRLLTFRDRIDTFAFDDPLPAVMEMATILKNKVQSTISK